MSQLVGCKKNERFGNANELREQKKRIGATHLFCKAHLLSDLNFGLSRMKRQAEIWKTVLAIYAEKQEADSFVTLLAQKGTSCFVVFNGRVCGKGLGNWLTWQRR